MVETIIEFFVVYFFQHEASKFYQQVEPVLKYFEMKEAFFLLNRWQSQNDTADFDKQKFPFMLIL